MPGLKRRASALLRLSPAPPRAFSHTLCDVRTRARMSRRMRAVKIAQLLSTRAARNYRNALRSTSRQ